ncbi:MAG: hypothetical protein KDB88_14625 [Flavobacteriales bacterium]|nr:hypothetical protein [Flavobacteriales bacterium]
MNTLLLALPLLLVAWQGSSPAVAQSGHLLLKDIITGPYQVPGSRPEESVLPKRVMLNATGGNLEATIKVKQAGDQRCHATYRFEWRFSQPIDSLSTEVAVNVDYRITLVEGPCTGDQGKMILMAATGFSPTFKDTGIRPRPAIKVTDGKWISTGDASYATMATIKAFNTDGPATLKFNLESVAPVGSSRLHYEVVYLFE